MKELSIGGVTITSIIERDGPRRTPQEMFPAYDPIIGKRHLVELDPPRSSIRRQAVVFVAFSSHQPGKQHLELVDRLFA